MHYLYRYRDGEKTIHKGTTHSLNRTYKRFFPNIYEASNEIVEYCLDNEKYYGELDIEYVPFESAEESEKALLYEESDLEWQRFSPITKPQDDKRYKEKLQNRLEYLRNQAISDMALHQFMIDNFNLLDEYSYFYETIVKPDSWDQMSNDEKRKTVMQHVETGKKYELNRNFFINVFSDFTVEEIDDSHLRITEAIESRNMPYLVASIYNTLIYTSHDLNTVLKYLNLPQIMVKQEEVPFYSAIKPLAIEYTKEKYVNQVENGKKSA